VDFFIGSLLLIPKIGWDTISIKNIYIKEEVLNAL
jgi:hypothetical protein